MRAAAAGVFAAASASPCCVLYVHSTRCCSASINALYQFDCLKLFNRRPQANDDSLLVIEEYDKLPCAARGLLRQLLASPAAANASAHRGLVLLESNLGMSELEGLLSEAGDRAKVGGGRDVQRRRLAHATAGAVWRHWLDSDMYDVEPADHRRSVPASAGSQCPA